MYFFMSLENNQLEYCLLQYMCFKNILTGSVALRCMLFQMGKCLWKILMIEILTHLVGIMVGL